MKGKEKKKRNLGPHFPKQNLNLCLKSEMHLNCILFYLLMYLGVCTHVPMWEFSKVQRSSGGS